MNGLLRALNGLLLVNSIAVCVSISVLADEHSVCQGRELTRSGQYLSIETGIDLSQALSCIFELDLTPQAQAIELQKAIQKNYMDDVRMELARQGFCCTQYDDLYGLTCRGHVDPYPKDIVVFIPATYRPTKELDMTIYFHGDLISRKTQTTGKSLDFDSAVLDGFDFSKILKDSGRNTILIVPASENQNRTFLTEFSAPPRGKGQFETFLDALQASFGVLVHEQTAKLGALTLTGHSRAYVTLNELFSEQQCQVRNSKACFQNRVRKIGIIDGTYGPTPNLTKWAISKQGSERILQTVFRKGSDTEPASRDIARLFCASSIEHTSVDSCIESTRNELFFEADASIDHMKAVDVYLPTILH